MIYIGSEIRAIYRKEGRHLGGFCKGTELPQEGFINNKATMIINKPGVAGAVLQSPLSLINSLIQ